MNGKISEFLLEGEKFMPKMHLKLAGFTYGTSGPFIKNKVFKVYLSKRTKKASCFQHDMGFGDFKDLLRRTAFDELLHDKVYFQKSKI